MKKNNALSKCQWVKQTLTLLLCVALMLGLAPGVGMSTAKAETDAPVTNTAKDINLGTAGIGNPTSTTTDAAAWAGSKVYYAGYECFVLDKDGTLNGGNSSVPNHMLLTTAKILSKKQAFNTSETADWSSSTIRYNLNNSRLPVASGGFLGAMTDLESNAVDVTAISQANTENGGIDGYPWSETKDKIFLLDTKDMNNANYGFASNKTRTASNWYWLRSPGDVTVVQETPKEYVAIVEFNGAVYNTIGQFPEYSPGAARPAFNVKASSVLFTSAMGTDKTAFAEVGKDNAEANTWKLTLKDSSKTVNVTDGSSVSQSGQTVTVPYTYTGDDVSQISIMITDKDYTESDASILYYGALDTDLAASGTGTFTLPKNLPDGYKIYMMAEDVNEGSLTDSSSLPVEITPTAPSKPEPTPEPTPAPTAKPVQMLNTYVSAGATQIKLNWSEVKGADGYYIYGNRCGKSPKKLKTVKGTTWTQKNLKKGGTYKYQVKAYQKTKNGTKILKTSLQVHVATLGSKKTNATSIRTNFTNAVLKKGATKQIYSTTIKRDPKEKLVDHVSKYRYRTNCSKVATVSSSGKIKAVGKGTCNIYVYANNGVFKKLTVHVK